MSQILYADTPFECKQLARDIANYEEGNWKQVAKNMYIEGLKEKFKQNPLLKDTLLKTEDKTLVECSYDKVWGNGVPLSNKNCLDKRHWINTGGILGDMLMKIRDTFRKELSAPPNDDEELMDTTKIADSM